MTSSMLAAVAAAASDLPYVRAGELAPPVAAAAPPARVHQTASVSPAQITVDNPSAAIANTGKSAAWAAADAGAWKIMTPYLPIVTQEQASVILHLARWDALAAADADPVEVTEAEELFKRNANAEATRIAAIAVFEGEARIRAEFGSAEIYAGYLKGVATGRTAVPRRGSLVRLSQADWRRGRS